MPEDDNMNHYLSRKHDGQYDYITSDRQGTLDKSESRESGLPYVYDKKNERKVDSDST
jgi:hypothetical protein